MSFETVLYSLDNGVATIQMNRPDALNALSLQLGKDLAAAVHLAITDDARAAILTGSGRAFCSGGDQKSLDKGTLPSPTRSGRHLIRNILEVEVPIIAAVNGVAVGLGVFTRRSVGRLCCVACFVLQKQAGQVDAPVIGD